jgi:hypothetical protein
MNTKLLKGARMRRRVRRAQRQLRRVLAECHVAHRCERTRCMRALLKCERVTTRARLYLVTRWFARWRDGEATWDEAPPFVCRGQSD